MQKVVSGRVFELFYGSEVFLATIPNRRVFPSSTSWIGKLRFALGMNNYIFKPLNVERLRGGACDSKKFE
jgi:hypothetical protein